MDEEIQETRVNFLQAWFLPKVLFYAFAYFAAKGGLQVVFFSLYEWLTDLGLDPNEQANVSTMNDIGGLIGSLLIGYISDLTYQKRSPSTIFAAFGALIIFYFMTFHYDGLKYSNLLALFFFYGLFMQGVTNTIAATCSADIGKTLKEKNIKAVSTVTGIIDGTGTIGAGIGQLILSGTYNKWGWQYGYLGLVSIF
jgi:OPA family glycerol-3-phosphate transporter-like MFS transporter 3